MIYCKRYEQGEELDPEWQLRDIMNTFQLFRCKYGIVDWGFGYDRYKKMQNVFGSRIAACYYSFNLKTERRWDRHENRWIVNRTEVINNYITAVKNLDIAWPGLDTSKFTWLFDNHLVEQAEYRKSINGKSEDLLYTHPEGQPDDGLHASIYAFLASIYYRFAGNPETIRFGSAYGNV
jgi:hypothetical protein